MARASAETMIHLDPAHHEYMVILNPSRPLLEQEAMVFDADGTVYRPRMFLHQLLRFGSHGEDWQPIPTDQVPAAVLAAIERLPD
jgi:hypothetical protein